MISSIWARAFISKTKKSLAAKIKNLPFRKGMPPLAVGKKCFRLLFWGREKQ
jgi:hypothetical protein